MAARFVTAYSKSTGRKHRVPEHFIGHPKLGRDLELTPSQRAADAATYGVVEEPTTPEPAPKPRAPKTTEPTPGPDETAAAADTKE